MAEPRIGTVPAWSPCCCSASGFWVKAPLSIRPSLYSELRYAQALPPAVLVRLDVDLAVLQHQGRVVVAAGALRVVDEGVHEVRDQRVPHVALSGISSALPLPFGSWVLNACSTLPHVLGGLRLLEPELLQPGRVHPQLALVRAVVAVDPLRQPVDLAVRRGRHRLPLRRGVERLLDVRRVLVDQLVQRYDDTLVRQLQQIGLAELVDPGDQQVQVRIVTAGQRDLPLLLGRPAVERGGLPLDGEVELLLHHLGEVVRRQVPVGRLRARTRRG